MKQFFESIANMSDSGKMEALVNYILNHMNNSDFSEADMIPCILDSRFADYVSEHYMDYADKDEASFIRDIANDALNYMGICKLPF